MVEIHTAVNISPKQYEDVRSRTLEMIECQLDSLSRPTSDYWHFAENLHTAVQVLEDLSTVQPFIEWIDE